METIFWSIFKFKVLCLFILPMRNGNLFPLSFPSYRNIFLSYLWGMETNLQMKLHTSLKHPFYPTYEEWKLLCLDTWWVSRISFLSYLWGMETSVNSSNIEYIVYLFILPMRNGNSYAQGKSSPGFPFLSYLWGMETDGKNKRK